MYFLTKKSFEFTAFKGKLPSNFTTLIPLLMIQLKTGNAWKGMLIVACAKGWEGGVGCVSTATML